MGVGSPKLTWTLNAEADLAGYEVYRKISTDYELIALVNPNTSYYVDNNVVLGTPYNGTVYYKIRAKDNHPNYSGYTSIVSYHYNSYNPSKIRVFVEDFAYKLNPNYPNPFNPTTKISYSIPEDAKVMLKVYDMLGTEVAELVNETQTPGYHETTFDASNLSSGVYIYRITAFQNNRILFSQSKQMILIK